MSNHNAVVATSSYLFYECCLSVFGIQGVAKGTMSYPFYHGRSLSLPLSLWNYYKLRTSACVIAFWSNLLFIKNPSQYSFNTWTPRYIIIIIPIIQLKTSNKIKKSVDAKLNFVWILICVTSCRLMGLTLLFSFSVTAPIRVGCKCQRWK